MIQLLFVAILIIAIFLIAFSLKKKPVFVKVGGGILIDGIEDIIEKRMNKKAPVTSISFGNMPDTIKMQIFQRYGVY